MTPIEQFLANGGKITKCPTVYLVKTSGGPDPVITKPKSRKSHNNGWQKYWNRRRALLTPR